MGKIVATFLVRVTLREPDEVEDADLIAKTEGQERAVPTIHELTSSVSDFLEGVTGYAVNADAEKTDV